MFILVTTVSFIILHIFIDEGGGFFHSNSGKNFVFRGNELVLDGDDPEGGWVDTHHGQQKVRATYFSSI